MAEDIGGADENSWKSRLNAAGYDVKVFTEGLGAFKIFRELYIEKLAFSLQLTEILKAET